MEEFGFAHKTVVLVGRENAAGEWFTEREKRGIVRQGDHRVAGEIAV